MRFVLVDWQNSFAFVLSRGLSSLVSNVIEGNLPYVVEALMESMVCACSFSMRGLRVDFHVSRSFLSLSACVRAVCVLVFILSKTWHGSRDARPFCAHWYVRGSVLVKCAVR